MEYRQAEFEDAKLLFDWANDPVTRQNSFSTGQIAWEDHIAWLKRKLADDASRLFIAMEEGKPCGTFRLDRKDPDENDKERNTESGSKAKNAYDGQKKESRIVISYSLAAECRGRGLGARILKLAEEACLEYFGGGILVGEVKSDNRASEKCFLKCGYINVSDDSREMIFEKKVK